MRNNAAMGRAVEAAAAAQGTPIAVTTGANPEHGRATAMTMVRGRLGVVRAAVGKPLTRTGEIGATTHVGTIATAIIASATSTRRIRSRVICAFRAVWSARPFAIVTGNTHSADPNHVRSRPLERFGLSPVVTSSDHNDRAADPRSGDLRHLREEGLIETVRVPGHRDHAVVLTKDGRGLLARHRDRDQEHGQTFYAGLKREREVEHDLQVYRAYERAEARLLERGAHIERVALDYELKRDYQKWLHEHDRERDDYDGHPDRTAEEIREWALEHDLPYFDDEVHFPDVRIKYEDPDGRWGREDVEIVTPHYRGAHGASVARSGFSCYRGISLSIGGRGGGGRGGAGRHGPAEELWY